MYNKKNYALTRKCVYVGSWSANECIKSSFNTQLGTDLSTIQWSGESGVLDIWQSYTENHN